MSGDNKFVIDQSTVTAELKSALSQSKRITLVGGDPSDTYMAEYLDKNGAWQVEIEEQPKSSTPSQRRKLMDNICSRSDRPDLVMSSSAGESDAGTGATLKGLATGRVSVKFTGTVELLRCRDKWKGQFNASVDMDQGIYNLDQTKMNQVIGQEAAKALMRLAGKPVPGEVSAAASESSVASPLQSASSPTTGVKPAGVSTKATQSTQATGVAKKSSAGSVPKKPVTTD